MLPNANAKLRGQHQEGPKCDQIQSPELNQKQEDNLSFVTEESHGIDKHETCHTGRAGRCENRIQEMHAAGSCRHFGQHQQHGACRNDSQKTHDKDDGRIQSYSRQNRSFSNQFGNNYGKEIALDK